MDTKVSSPDHTEEDFIDMEVTSSSSTRLLLSCTTDLSPQQSREFEFQMSCSSTNDKDTNTSPADELFYNGKLLPLHQPPHLQMLQNFLQSSNIEEQSLNIPLHGTRQYSTAPCTKSNTPFDSCNISPSQSCRVSCELNPDDFHFDWSKDLSSFIDGNNIPHQPKKSNWSKKLRLIKDIYFGQKLKSSRAYLKSIFNKSACPDEPGSVAEKGYNTTLVNMMKVVDKEESNNNEGLTSHRRSFSRALKRHSPAKCLSSSSSGSSSTTSSASSSSFSSSSSSSAMTFHANGTFRELQFLKRSSSDTTEVETSIQAAIAHCKKSQHVF